MSYTKLTDFAIKDSLPSGTGAKIVRGTELDAEFNAIQADSALKAPLASPTFTGTVTVPTPVNATDAATKGVVDALQTQIDAKAPLASPALTGVPTAPTATLGTNTTQLATTAFVQTQAFSAAVPVVPADSGKYLTNNGTVSSWSPIIADASQTLTPSGSVTWGTASGNIATITLNQNITMAAPTGLSARSYILVVNQDATGSRTITWNSVFKWAGGALPVLSTAANAKDVFSFYSDGTNMYGSYLRGLA